MTAKLSDKTKRVLGEFLTTENDSFKDMDLYINRDTKQLTQKALDIIEASPTLVSLLNAYSGKYKWGDPNEFGGGGGYQFKNNEMTIGYKRDDGVDYHTFVDVLIIIGHEAAHASGKYQHRRSEEKEYDFADSREYSESYLRGEGEANYYEYKIVKEMEENGIVNEYQVLDGNEFKTEVGKINWDNHSRYRNVWSNAPQTKYMTHFGSTKYNKKESYTKEMSKIIERHSEKEILNNENDVLLKIGYMIGDLVPNPITMKDASSQDVKLGFTYADSNKIRFLHKKSDLYDDYYEVMKHAPYILDSSNAKKNSDKKIKNYHLNFYQMKSLVNNSYGYNDKGEQTHSGMFGEKQNDTIFNNINGTPLVEFSEKYDSIYNNNNILTNQNNETAFDLMYGGAGNDTLMGGNKKDIVLGGSDDDHLYGKGGADIIGGNKGNDHLYAAEDEKGMYKSAGGEELPDADKNILVGGEGNDHLYGGTGEDDLFGDERLPEGEELKKESYKSADDDYLQGNAGNDNMYGGKGHDTYVIEDKDTIYDVNGGGEIWFVKESGKNISKEKIYGYQAKNFIFDENNKNEEAWISADDGGNADNMLVAKRVFDDLVIKSKIRENDTAIIKDYFDNYSDGKLGITLGKKKEPPPAIRRNHMGL